MEIKILELLKKNDPHHNYNIVSLFDSFPFRKHMVLVFEILGDNLYKHIVNRNYKKVDYETAKLVAYQTVVAL
jgi:serine/threonine protein kinase